MNIEMANRLTALRKQHELSQEQLAERLGVSRQAVSKWERAEASPDIENLSSLARLYGITIDELVNGVPPSESNSEASISGQVNGGHTNGSDPDDHEKDGSSGAAFLLRGFPFPIVVLIAYLLTGFLLDWWYINWVFFLLIPCWYGMLTAIRTHRLVLFPYPVLITAVYFVLGLQLDLWHPGWLVYVTIPIYYWIADAVRRSRR